FTLLHGSGLISHASPFFFSSICLCPTRSPLFPYTTLFRSCDVLLAVGARFDDRVINGAAKFCPNAKIIHIDIDPASISKTIKADIPIVGPVDSVLTDMLAALKDIGTQPNPDVVASWWKQIDEWRGNGKLFPYDSGDGSIIKPQAVIEVLSEVTKGDAFVTSDVGQHQMFA